MKRANATVCRQPYFQLFEKEKINTPHFLHNKQTDQNTVVTLLTIAIKKEKEPNDTIPSVHKQKWFDSSNHFLSAEKSFIDKKKNEQNKTVIKICSQQDVWCM